MADQLYLFTGTSYDTVEIELALATDSLQALTPGTELGTAGHNNTWSASPDNLGFRLLDHQKENRIWPVRLLIGNKDAANPADSMQNAFQKLQRLIKQARRFEMEEDVDPVGLVVLLDGATNKTMFLVKDMEINGISVFDEASRTWGNAQSTFMMVTEPLGFGEEETLESWVKTPHMQEDINSDGLADNWNEYNNPVTSLSTTYFLCGSKSQSVLVGPTATEGIYSDTIACTAYQSDDFVSYVWVYRLTGSDEITFDVVGDDSGSLGTAEYGAATTTIVSPDGNTWSRLEVTGTVGAADTTITLRVERLAGDANEITRFYVDKAYFQFGVDTIPTGWCSQRVLYQHSRSEEGAVNYIDTEDILGDEEADTEFVIVTGNVHANGYYYIGRRSNDRVGAATGFFMDVTGDQVDAARLGDDYWTNTPSGTRGSIQDQQDIPNLAVNGKSGLYRVFVSVMDGDGADAVDANRADFSLRYFSATDAADTPWVKFPVLTNTDYTWLDLGVVDFSRHTLRHEYGSDILTSYVVSAKRDNGSVAVRMDGVYFMPIETDALFVFYGEATSSNYELHANSISTDDDMAFYQNTVTPGRFINAESLGSIPKLYAGNFSRTFFLGGAHETLPPVGKLLSFVPHWFTVKIKYKPRTTFLFGVPDVS